MRRIKIGIVGLAACASLGCWPAPVLWSPDGHWLAYTMASRAVPPRLGPGWLFETAGTETGAEASAVPSPRALRRQAPLVYRLWATQAETGASVLLEESRGPLTSPTWSPDGHALAFGRLVFEEEGRARFEVVVQEAPDRKRVVLARPAGEFHARGADLPGLSLAWSPDGRYLAVPLPQQSLSLAIIRADNGRVLKVVEDAYLPAWSPDGTKLAFVQGSDAESLHYLDHNFGPTRHLADLGQTSQAPAWSRDSRSVAVLARRTTQRRREPPSQQTDLLRVHIESGKVDLITTLHTDPGDRDPLYHGSSFGFDRDGNELFHASDIEGQLTEITWYRPRTGETLDKFHPIDPTVRIGALAVAPDGKTLALRLGSPGDLSTPALVDLASKKLVPLVPDDAARLEWLSTLVQAAVGLLRAQLPAADARNRPLDRPTLLPVPGELPANPDITSRLRRLGRIGRPLCERPADAPPVSPALSAALAEARLFFDYLREDYAAALGSLEALEPRLANRDQRLRLLGVRAQIFLGQKQFEQAARTIAFLEAVDARPGQRIEQTPEGLKLVPDTRPSRGWPSYLSERAAALVKAGEDAAEVPPGRHNPDFGNPNADFVAPPAGAPIPFAPLIQVAPPFMPLVPEFELQPGPGRNRPAPPRPRLLPRARRPAPRR